MKTYSQVPMNMVLSKLMIYN